ncbi:hypothetical protein N310_03050, partial [Acanthisitta chloris]
AVSNSSRPESAEMTMETFPTATGNSYTVFGTEEAGKADMAQNDFTKSEEEESLPMHLKYVLLQETMFVELKKRKIRLRFSEHWEKWFAESLSNSHVFVAAKKEELNSILMQHLQWHQLKQEEIQTNIYNVRAGELLLHEENLKCHCAGLGEGLKKEKAELLKFQDQLKDLNTKLRSQICDIESALLHTPVAEHSTPSQDLQLELHNHLEFIQLTARSFQQHLEEALGKLRASNVEFLETCR